MIRSASRRTDLPAFYSEWFFQRLKEGYVLVRNPFSAHQVSRIALHPDVVDGIVFWSKNPAPMMKHLSECREYPFYFQFTLNAYGKDVEPGLPSLEERIRTFLYLSEQIGPERVLWRYDPVLLNKTYTIPWHREQFRFLCSRLAGATALCTFSFLDFYPKIAGNLRSLETIFWTKALQWEIAESLAETADAFGIPLVTCAEQGDFSSLGISHGNCIDSERMSRIAGIRIRAPKDRNQRTSCGCCESIDIGRYNTCRNGCRYCYANRSSAQAAKESALYRPDAPLLCSELEEADRVTERKMVSFKETQMNLWDL